VAVDSWTAAPSQRSTVTIADVDPATPDTSSSSRTSVIANEANGESAVNQPADCVPVGSESTIRSTRLFASLVATTVSVAVGQDSASGGVEES
jgi:hypothetical protein